MGVDESYKNLGKGDVVLNQKYRDGFLAQVELAKNGDVVFVPNALDRVGDVFNLHQSRYTTLVGPTGSGKTSFADYLYVLQPWTNLKNLPKDTHWEVIYFSLERKQMYKHAKWVSWMIYRDHGVQISADDLMGWGNRSENLSDSGYDLIRSYDKEISELLSHVHIYDGKVEIDVIERVIQKRAEALGDFYYTDGDALYRQGNPVPLESFEDKNLVESTPVGDRKFIEWVHKGKPFKIYEDDHKYFLHNPKTFVFIVIDGIGLLGGSDFGGKKSALDRTSGILASARDYFGFSPIVISQINRSLGDTQRKKLHGADLSPQIDDVQGSSQMSHDSDLVLAIFDPYKYKAYDENGYYGGYFISPKPGDTKPSMQTPGGVNRFRSLHILKNTFGVDGRVFGMKFLGESNDFSVLPWHKDAIKMEFELDQVYSDIAKGL